MNDLITQLNDALWGYVLIAALVTCGLWFTWKTKGVQFRMIGEIFRLLTDSATTGTSGLQDANKEHKHISSFQAFAVSVATRVGTGNLAGVATAPFVQHEASSPRLRNTANVPDVLSAPAKNHLLSAPSLSRNSAHRFAPEPICSNAVPAKTFVPSTTI